MQRDISKGNEKQLSTILGSKSELDYACTCSKETVNLFFCNARYALPVLYEPREYLAQTIRWFAGKRGSCKQTKTSLRCRYSYEF